MIALLMSFSLLQYINVVLLSHSWLEASVASSLRHQLVEEKPSYLHCFDTIGRPDSQHIKSCLKGSVILPTVIQLP